MEEISQQDAEGKIIVFVETKRKVEKINYLVNRRRWSSVCMHGDKSQSERDAALADFRSGRCNILIATDVAARGLGKYSKRETVFYLQRKVEIH